MLMFIETPLIGTMRILVIRKNWSTFNLHICSTEENISVSSYRCLMTLTCLETSFFPFPSVQTLFISSCKATLDTIQKFIVIYSKYPSRQSIKLLDITIRFPIPKTLHPVFNRQKRPFPELMFINSDDGYNVDKLRRQPCVFRPYLFSIYPHRHKVTLN